MAIFLASTYANQNGYGGERPASGSSVKKNRKDNNNAGVFRRDRGAVVRHIPNIVLAYRLKRSPCPPIPPGVGIG